jgi:hypothetical protein
MKLFPLLAVAIAALVSTTAPSQAKTPTSKQLARLAGSYHGSGTFVDSGAVPGATYTYAFSKIVAKATINKKKKTGTFSGTADLTITYRSGSTTFVYPSTKVTVSGTTKKAKLSGRYVQATGQLKFSNETAVDGTLKVPAKKGKGSFKAKYTQGPYKVDFALTK